ncbi:glycosyltransferase [Polynucleobacter campilacus]|uniref:Glycosyltransferase 2-like domain-containing protein n=1 Tax=Polynucleobacter campilacus TaxID=1743163 RepID=A0A254PVV5_9BURK|nr:glycosyltransferase [Polynucleobacter campilacus]OWS70689.1 hypothetical protein CBI31_00080 [Polynucleobacter campilacus]
MHNSYLLIVVVTYKRPNDVLKLIESLQYQRNCELKIIVIDTSVSQEDSFFLEKRIQKNESLMYIVASSNLGYAKGNNFGVRKAVKVWGEPLFVIISNDDIEITDNYLLHDLSSLMLNNIFIDCLQPKINMTNGFIQGPYNKANIYIESLQYLFPFYWYINRFIKQYKLHNIKKLTKFYRIMGAFFIIKYKTFEEVGMFDEATFLGREEDILAGKLNKARYKTFYYPLKIVKHLQLSKEIQCVDSFNDSDLYYWLHIEKVNIFSLKFYLFSKYVFNNLYAKFFKFKIKK